MLEIVFFCIIVALIGLNVFTVWFYQKQIQLMIDKSLSRSYSEYVQAKNLEQEMRFPAITQEKPEIEDDAVLSELNQILG